MSKTLLQMRQDIRNLLDDQGSSRFTDDMVASALEFAIAAVANLLVSSGYANMSTTVTVTMASGVITVPANDGVRNVYLLQGGNLSPIRRGNGTSRSIIGAPSAGSVVVEYIAKSPIPTLDATIITYAGVNIDDPIADKYCAYFAAQDLKTIEAEPNGQIEKMLPVLEDQLRRKYSPVITVASASVRSGMANVLGDAKWYTSGPTTVTVYS